MLLELSSPMVKALNGVPRCMCVRARVRVFWVSLWQCAGLGIFYSLRIAVAPACPLLSLF